MAHLAALFAALAAVASCLALVSAPAARAAPLSGSSFDTGDGNQENGLHLDWQNAASTGRAVEAPDPNASDSCYVGGVKENTPNQWAYTTAAGGCTPGKSNVRAAWANPESTGATTFAHFAFWRNDTSGNSFLTFELNQVRSTWVNARGTTIPCRTNGDILLSLESAGGSSLATAVYKWTGDGTGPAACPNGANGTFTSSGAIGAANSQGSMNPAAAFNHLNPATYGSSFPKNSFGEAAVNLPAVLQSMGQNRCFGFLQMQVHSRSSSSISSALIDTTAPVAVYLQSCSATGTKYRDENGNGVRDAGEPGLAGFTFYADFDDDGVKDAGEPSGTSDSTGFYRILGVSSGTYKIREVDQDGWACTGPAPCLYSRSFVTGGNSTGNDFGNAAPSTASGTKFDDLNGNGLADAGEPGRPGVTFYVDYDDDGTKDATEPSGSSDATGAWSISNIEAGTHKIREVAQPGWTCSLPAPCHYTRTFTSGSAATGLTFGNWTAATVSGNLFEDLDGDGASREAGEPGLSGWQVYVDANGNDAFDFGETSTTTDASGNYTLAGLAPGSRTVRATMPSNSWYCTRPSLTQSACERTVTLVSGETASGNDLGFARYATVSGSKFEDANNNGSRDVSESGVAGFVFYVDYDNDDVLDAGEPQATSAATTGAWSITGVRAGSHPVREVPQAGWTCTKPASTCRYDLAIGSGSTHTAQEFGNYIVRSVSGTVFRDSDADAAAREAGEPGVVGWTVYSDENGNSAQDPGEASDVTNSEGFYILTGLPNGAYRVRVVSQSGWTCSYPAGCLNTGSLGNSADASDFGKDFGVWAPGTISGNVFEDADADGGANEPGEGGLSGRTVYLDSNSNGALDAGEPSATSDASGDYTISSVNPGTYTVRQELPGGWTCSFPTLCSYSVTIAGAAVTGRDFASWSTGTVAGSLYEDRDADGVQEGGEAALAGWTVYLDLDGDSVKDAGEPESTADGSGDYAFARPPGAYTVRAVVSAGWTCSQPTPCAYDVTATSQSSTTGRVFGLHTTGSITGTVYEDANFDGSVPDAGESPLAGETVYLDADDDGALDPGETQATTDAGGAYSFAAVAPGAHVVRLAPRSAWTCSSPAACRREATVLSQSAEAGNDFGTYLGAEVSGTVFEDLDADGQPQETGEGPLAGVRVYLDADADGARDGGEPSTLTDAAGAYLFSGIEAQTWDVRVELSSGWSCDSPSPCRHPIVLTSGGSEAGLEFGVHAPASISGHLFTDRDNDQEPQEFGENDQPGRTVYVDTNDDGGRDAGEPAAITGEDGTYTLASLAPGTYRVRQELPAGWTCSTPSPCSRLVTVVSRQEESGHDFSSWATASFSGLVFEDLDGDGAFPENGEPGLPGRTVYIDADDDGVMDAGEQQATTDAGGSYGFGEVVPGTHVVRTAPLPAGWQSSYPSGESWTLTLEANEAAQNVDFGSYTTGTVSGEKFEDMDGDGNRDAGEGGLSGWAIYADLDSDGTHDAGEPSDTTGTSGAYSLALDPGSYTIREQQQSGWTCSQPTPCEYQVTVTSRSSAPGRVFGNWEDSTASGTKFYDFDNDRQRDADEDGLAGWTFYADYDGDGDRDAGEPAATSAADGTWTIEAIRPGNHAIREVEQASWVCTTPDPCDYARSFTSGSTPSGLEFGNTDNGVISGSLFEDLDADGAHDPDDPALAGATVWLDLDDDGERDAGEPSRTTGASGAYSLRTTGGSFAVRAEGGSGWTCSSPGPCRHDVTLGPADASTGNDFGLWTVGAASGRQSEDLDGDGSLEAGEPAAAGWVVYADVDDDGEFDAGEPTATGGIDGTWQLELDPGSYLIRQVGQVGWTCSYPAHCEYAVTVRSRSSSPNRHFAAWHQGAISGTAFEDLDADGDPRESGEPPLAGRTVFIDDDGDGRRDPGEPEATTGADGAYSFDVDPGSFDVLIEPEAGWTQSRPADAHTVTVSSSQARPGNDFGLWTTGAISGTSFEDADRDGARDDAEGPLPGRTLYLDRDDNGRRDAGEEATETDADGRYAFAELEPGRYSVRELLPQRWNCSAPAGCLQTVMLSSRQSADARDFGSWREPDPVEPQPEAPTIGTPTLSPTDRAQAEIRRERDPRTGTEVYLVSRTAECMPVRFDIPIDAVPGSITDAYLVLHPDGGGDAETVPLADAPPEPADGTWSGTIPCARDGKLELVLATAAGEIRREIGEIRVVESKKPVLVAERGCVIRPVNARVRGRLVERVVFYLDGRHVKTVRRADARGRFGVTLDRSSLEPGRHLLRAKVVFKRRAHRKPAVLKLTIKRCLASAPPKALKAGPGASCGTQPFLAWVRSDRIRRVAFRLDGRRLRTVRVADWRGRYGALIDPSTLARGRHEITARIEFVARSGLRARTLALRFTKCR